MGAQGRSEAYTSQILDHLGMSDEQRGTPNIARISTPSNLRIYTYYYQHLAEIDAHMQADADEATALLAEVETQGKLIRIE